ncbi:Glutaredoxin [Coemansia erecta]|uniref:Glutaredoxin n=1 Tax=Coemansia asiatica TaxID=1052880 RepID=A0A9W7XQ91_9FUNG|nr:Glutaredoxin [Coemansia asiatica]KAJ2847158.1 Glutaredoxin [Coemansia erecta]KAJ2877412.1 Glutaredoxin [Coemansia asiatica]
MGSALSAATSSVNPAEMTAASKLARALIKDNAVMVFSKSYCPFCQHAKSALKENKIAFEAIELDQRKDGGAIQDALQTITGQRTVPNIFANGYHIGGCDDTLAALKSKEFQKKLNNTTKGPFAVETSSDVSKPSTSTEPAAASTDKAQL